MLFTLSYSFVSEYEFLLMKNFFYRTIILVYIKKKKYFLLLFKNLKIADFVNNKKKSKK